MGIGSQHDCGVGPMSWENLFKDLRIGRIAETYPLTYMDLGTRDGFQDDLSVLAFAVHAIGFEPEPEEFVRLSNAGPGPWATRRLLPFAVSSTGGSAVLYVSKDRDGSSLLSPLPAVGKRFNKTQFFDLERTVDVETRTLQETLGASEIDSIDYLKIDIEGAELGVFEASPAVLDDILVIKTEACYLPVREGQGLVHEIDACLGENGFELMDVVRPAHWRREGHVIHPRVSDAMPPYARGQLIHGDFLYFRDPTTLDDRPERLIRLGLLAAAMGYFDHALMAFERDAAAEQLAKTHGEDVLDTVNEASRVYGRRALGQAFFRQLRAVAGLVCSLPRILRV